MARLVLSSPVSDLISGRQNKDKTNNNLPTFPSSSIMTSSVMSHQALQPQPLPHLPNELRIRILSFIDDPNFLWNTCRSVAPEFQQWAEETYASVFIPKVKFDMRLTSRDPSDTEETFDGELVDEISYLMQFSHFKNDDISIACFRPSMKPFVHYVDTEGMHAVDDIHHMLINDTNWEHACQMVPELEWVSDHTGKHTSVPVGL